MQSSDDAARYALNNALERWLSDYRLCFLRGAIHIGSQHYDAARSDFEINRDISDVLQHVETIVRSSSGSPAPSEKPGIFPKNQLLSTFIARKRDRPRDPTTRTPESF
ncbi:hypothetical protein [Burkholderia lata]|nr:hypothetical protein [Burkholderia lata]